MHSRPPNIYLLPPYATNKEFYSLLEFDTDFHPYITYINWMEPLKDESIASYAMRIIVDYRIQPGDILIGTSMGGVISIEISKIIPIRLIVAISCIKDHREKPLLFHFLRKTKTYYLAKGWLMKSLVWVIVPFYGRNPGRFNWFRKAFQNTPNSLLEWGLKEHLYWKNTETPDNLYHIHGTKDPLFPFRNIRDCDYPITGGTHAMVRFRAKEISSILNDLLNRYF